MLLANSGGRIVLVYEGTSCWVAPMLFLLPRLVRSRTGGSLLIFCPCLLLHQSFDC